ncbi:tRNA lysidine(34) synthetase TilS [Sphingobium sp. DEHP117]|uniref:tRNA lysidine(34) synthetase TilS n=1 Tax=Sphingobium sp. DEHP117 TaxID=2993436 RepID=UPI0027D4F8D4|nr:tRNA lysidine(34) synthetase TilS [Sphingobium sp. DEHP117]MDQ4420464.1 tRNA lysidine(34) synthetase TilS [Sphingobium sp. DEHP117]
MPSAAPEPWVERFRRDCTTLIGADAAGRARFGIAVSGGPDSMALLWLAAQAFPGRTCAATVDHRLRAEARAEAEMVARWCAAHGIPHAILSPPTPIGGSIQASAREARYALLHAWRVEERADWLLTAHHADDQLETLLMRLNRSSGVGGMAGIRARNGAVLRPLLGWRRAELMEVVHAHDLPHVHDPSNDDARFDRVEMRRNLAGVDWLDPLAASRTAAACADAEDALAWLVDDLAARHIRADGEGSWVLDRHDFPREVQRRLIVRMVQAAEPDIPAIRGETIDQALVQLLHGKQASIGRWLVSGGALWRLVAAPRRSGG